MRFWRCLIAFKTRSLKILCFIGIAFIHLGLWCYVHHWGLWCYVHNAYFLPRILQNSCSGATICWNFCRRKKKNMHFENWRFSTFRFGCAEKLVTNAQMNWILFHQMLQYLNWRYQWASFWHVVQCCGRFLGATFWVFFSGNRFHFEICFLSILTLKKN